MTTHQDKPLPFKEVGDNVRRKHPFLGGSPKPLIRVDKDSK